MFKPKVFFTICEYGPEQYMGIAAAKKLGIKTVALQHGVIHPSHNGYYHHLENISKTDEDFTNYVLPDITCVQGEYEKRILLKYGYPKEKVVVTGQPRYDLLYYADKIYDKKQIFKQLELDPNKELIVWTTQTHGLSLEENKKNINAIYSTAKALKNVQLVIKLHPGEDQGAALYKKNESFNPIIKGKEMDTYALLYACDLMITRHSTTAMEAVALNKPVIVLNLSGEQDPVEYVEEGVALGVYKEEDLKSAIEKLLQDDSELAKNRAKYIEKYLYKIDGKASERVVNVIGEMIANGRRAS
jgi:surface carbohydrate biosynthesis protein